MSFLIDTNVISGSNGSGGFGGFGGFGAYTTYTGYSGSSGNMANWTLPEGWDSGIITNHLVDTDGDGALDSVEIVVNGGQPLEPIHYVDIGGGSWGLVGGLSFGDNGQMGIFTGVGLPGLQFGVGSEESGQLPSGWDTDSAPGVILRSGAMPIAGYDKIYWNPENGQSYI